jgi:hypothetical protein
MMQKRKASPRITISLFLAGIVWALGLLVTFKRNDSIGAGLPYLLVGWIVLIVGNVWDLRIRVERLEKSKSSEVVGGDEKSGQ